MKERPDAPAVTIARTEVVKPGNPPIAFTPTCDVATIQPKNRYVVRGRILVDGKLMFTTDTAVPVIAAGNPLQVSLILQRVSAAQAGTGAGS